MKRCSDSVTPREARKRPESPGHDDVLGVAKSRGRHARLFVPAIANLKNAGPLALEYDWRCGGHSSIRRVRRRAVLAESAGRRWTTTIDGRGMPMRKTTAGRI
jgi:hypothetical protein